MFNAFKSRLFIRQFISFFLLVMLTFAAISGTLLVQTRHSLELGEAVMMRPLFLLIRIIGFSTRVLRSAGDTLTPTQQENLAIVRREANHLLEMINDLLDYSRIEAGRMEMVCEAFDLLRLASETVSSAEQLLEDEPSRIRIRMPEMETLPCRSDRIGIIHHEKVD